MPVFREKVVQQETTSNWYFYKIKKSLGPEEEVRRCQCTHCDNKSEDNCRATTAKYENKFGQIQRPLVVVAEPSVVVRELNALWGPARVAKPQQNQPEADSGGAPGRGACPWSSVTRQGCQKIRDIKLVYTCAV
ncbi:uncharacterized protein LOC129756240 [Uranotaenia lowii]|uniref:uncharacterized protein LOC129756240 n=1 Tax=Uranotaenia lowii TaxID=190385 RepID=UPI002478DC45|nr:uncharacterized protein LOC129756240 [Uranotaenia lowii]